ncbi:MAG: OsmC family protein [Aquificaceae bacterium]|nr:OsmC family protein [Aquificaceae bacterium]MCS7277776.1 OsmC family protein [Aquificaceae bacterium]MDW8066548.1 OsmC family protein [Aquificaceae bacterium]MDW8423122.1 OsmC family protein [Aquificaceae bacterium]
MEEKKVTLSLSEEEHTYIAQTSYGELLVGEHGYKPMELILVALAGCGGVDVSNILRKKRQEVRDIQIQVVGYRRDEHPRVYERIVVKYKVFGKDIKEKAVEEAIRLSLEKYCSVYAMLKNSANIEYTFEVVNET